jgi:3-hydroxyacyl-[acyl-carrier-protein] dehydratase
MQANVENRYTMPINIIDIMKHMPHSYPFLLIDRVIAATPSKSITAIKNVTINEPFFVGHFPGYPVMPGVLIIEAMAQAAGMLVFVTHGKKDNEIFFFASVNNVKFKRQVIPGDTLRIEVECLKEMRGMSKYRAYAFVEGVVAAEAELMIAKKEV